MEKSIDAYGARKHVKKVIALRIKEIYEKVCVHLLHNAFILHY